MKRYTAHNESVDGSATDEEIRAARAVRHINVFMPKDSLFDVMDRYRERCLDGWTLSHSGPCHTHDPKPPKNLSSPILMGFIKIRSGDPHYPVWLHRKPPNP